MDYGIICKYIILQHTLLVTLVLKVLLFKQHSGRVLKKFQLYYVRFIQSVSDPERILLDMFLSNLVAICCRTNL